MDFFFVVEFKAWTKTSFIIHATLDQSYAVFASIGQLPRAQINRTLSVLELP